MLTASMTTTEVVKRRKVSEGKKAVKPRLFSPFRTIGQTTTGLPFAVGTLGSTFYIATSVGRSFQIFDANTLHLLFVTQGELSSEITALAAHYHYVYAAYGEEIGIFKRGRLEHSMTVEGGVKRLLVFGDYLIGSNDKTVFVFKKSAGMKVATEFYTKFGLEDDIVGIVHPPTYLNKIVVLTATGLSIYNIHSGKLLYSTSFSYTMTAIECAPVLDIVALGTTTGEVILYNIKKGKTLRTMTTKSSVTSISFRTDGPAHLCIGHTSGDLTFFDLDRNARIHVLNAHRETHGGVSKAQFLNGQPIIVTNGGDNHLKEFVFDPPLSSNGAVVAPPRYLRSRGGHAAPVTSFEFADDDGHYILSGSRDKSVWKFSLRKDAQSQEMSQRAHKRTDGKREGGIKDKFPEVIGMAVENTRVGEWENVVTAHEGENVARTWDSHSRRVGRHKLATIDGGVVKSVAASPCGNFALVGSSNGGIGVHNLQSGQLRKKYNLHKKAVTGLALDGMNRKMVSCGLDGVVGFYDFSQSKYLGKLVLDAPITSMVYHRSSDLFALALDDLSVVVVDAVTHKVVRVFWGHSNRITAMAFSPDGRWIVTAALDSTIRTWDIPTGLCIDGIRVSHVATNIKFSPVGDFLATTHVARIGISLWTNRAQFRPVSTRNVEEDEFTDVSLSMISDDVTLLDGAFDEEVEEEYTNHYESVDQIDNSLLTLSLGPRSKFQTLLNIDTIKQRNKPKEAPKKPKNAPFFLQLSGAQIGDEASVREGKTAILSKNGDDQDDETKLHAMKPVNGTFESEFTRLLRVCSGKSDYAEFLKYFTLASPAVTDLEIKTMSSVDLTEMKYFVEALTQGFKSNTDVDLIEAWMTIFLKNHGDVIHGTDDEELKVALDLWFEAHKEKTDNFDDLVKYCSGVISLLTTV
ncbi:CYFA0S11e03422g1_1 [Cyberlindnera fabianii]|uniref:CYFA0S11e03422g1_1 n=1 Tax=Cyberlindnera fabianii TaxID=36022 RepID=A0A061B6E0_CYBFA|nr:CYFA0S11e03422g1_1 [Cyberlindnera fabianii]